MSEQLDGQGKRYITLAQFLKMIQAAESGGAAKALARTGGASVNGERETRPGRKLHHGTTVTIGGTTHTVDLTPKAEKPQKPGETQEAP
ncbi:MAG: RNA-binding S4 domain-containing protein [Planctomycetes bacterium]|nr:RNA-binding S4 domain-containing protein [Planctomycetota bacterium]